MRIKGKLSHIRLLVLVLLFAGVPKFAQAAADSNMPAAGPASHKTTSANAGAFVISDRTFLMKSIAEVAMNRDFSSQSAGNCSSSASSIIGVGKSLSFCSRIDCAAPPPGCYYGPPDTDAHGCAIDCGQLICGPPQ